MRAKLVAVISSLLSLALIVSAGLVVLSRDQPAGGSELERMPPMTRHAYQLALDQGDLFAHVPCYCGCALLSEPHKRLLDCFIDGSGQFDAHASSCSTCVDIALAAEEASDAGLSHAQISEVIDTLFAGRGPRTPTQAP